jgi:molecular chaperone DnaK
VQGERKMAAGNKTLGRFTLSGIPSAPRGIPQIEVTFDIDANGIVNVSAKDKGTGKEAKITITASTNLSDDEIDAAVKEAEKFADEDKARKETIEVKNSAEQLSYQTKKTLTELGEKVSEEDKKDIEAKLEALDKVKEGEETEAIKKATEELTEAFYAVTTKIYQADAEAAQGQGENPDQDDSSENGPQDDNVVDADFKVDDKE